MKRIFKMGNFITMQIFFQLIISNFLSHSIQAWYCKVANDLFCGKKKIGFMIFMILVVILREHGLQRQNNYLWTYDLYGPAHKDFDAGGWIML